MFHLLHLFQVVAGISVLTIADKIAIYERTGNIGSALQRPFSPVRVRQGESKSDQHSYQFVSDGEVFFCILIKLFPSPEISEDSIGLDPNPMEHLTFTNIGEMNNNNTRSLPHRG